MKRSTLLCLLIAAAGLSCSRKQASAPAPLPEVATMTVTRQPVLLTTELPGRTCAYLVAEIRPQVSGLIQKRLFVEGADVRAGEDLYQIDPAPFRAALDTAKAALDRAEASVPALRSRADRFREALADKAVSQQAFDDADAALKQAEADAQYWRATMETARINLGYARVVSPISGRIGKSSVTDGAIVTAYQPLALATIQQLDPIYVDIPQSTTELLNLQRRLEDGRLNRSGTNVNEVQLILADGTAYPLTGTLQFRDISVDPSTASVVLRAIFPNPNGVLLPGMFVRGIVKEGMNNQAILIPQQAVSRDPKGNPVALIVSGTGTAEPRLLAIERAIGDQWLVSSGLAPGDQLIVEGLQRVRPGVPVKAVPLGPKPAPGPGKGAPATLTSN